jgi:hypothetical protein
MQMNLLRKVSLPSFRAASSSDAVKPTPCARIGFGRAGAAGHRRTTRLESSVRNLGGLAVAKAKRGVGRGHSSGEAGQCPWMRRASACKRDDANQMARTIMSKDCNRGQSAMWRRVGNRSSIWRSIHRNQCETEPRGEGERN